jgi:hypothetical protein
MAQSNTLYVMPALEQPWKALLGTLAPHPQPKIVENSLFRPQSARNVWRPVTTSGLPPRD